MPERNFPNPTELEIQIQVFQWAEWQCGKWPELRLLNASLNGLRTSKAQAGKAKAAGMKRGYPDIFLPAPRGEFHGLFIELKRPGESPREEQMSWLRALRSQGYAATWAVGFDETISVILDYLTGGSVRWRLL